MDAKISHTYIPQNIQVKTTANFPAVTDSKMTRALEITKIALFAIAAATALVALGTGFTVGPIALVPAAIAVIFAAAGILFRALENKSRIEDFYKFALESNDLDTQITYMHKAAEEGHLQAIKWEYTQGMSLIQEASLANHMVDKKKLLDKGFELLIHSELSSLRNTDNTELNDKAANEILQGNLVHIQKTLKRDEKFDYEPLKKTLEDAWLKDVNKAMDIFLEAGSIDIPIWEPETD